MTPMEYIVTWSGKRVPLTKYLAPPVDDTEIVYTDDEGNLQRTLLREYLREDH